MIITAPLVIWMCIIFVLVFLFVNTIDNRKWLTILVSLALTPLAYFYMLYPMINIFTNYHHQKRFSVERWHEKPSFRYEMSDDMMASKMLIGKSERAIDSLLGAAEWLTYKHNLKSHDTHKWNYGLGVEPGAFNRYKECMELIFRNDTLSSMSQYQVELILDDED